MSCSDGSARSWRSRTTAQKRLDKIVIADRRQHGGGGVLHLCDAPRRGARTLRHRRPEARSRPPVATEGRRRPGRHDRGDGDGPQSRRRATHPAFKYLPETGEEIYHSFLGVPIMRGGTVIGVLVVQNRTRRHYSEEEEEALQTTAMVLAEVIASGELQGSGAAKSRPTSRISRSHHLQGRQRSPRAWRSAMSCCTSRASSSRT